MASGKGAPEPCGRTCCREWRSAAPRSNSTTELYAGVRKNPSTSEKDPCSYLPLAGRSGGANQPEGLRAEVHARRNQIRVIESVEELTAKLEARVFRQDEIPQQRKIRDDPATRPDNAHTFVAKCERSRLGKSARVEPAAECPLARVQVRIARDIRPLTASRERIARVHARHGGQRDSGLEAR